jgi:hypothetical protein
MFPEVTASPVLAARKLATPRALGVTVTRLGERVELTIGDAGPFRFTYEEAMRTGTLWLRESVKARRADRPAELTLGRHKMHTRPAALRQVGHWLLAKGAEAKFVRGDGKKRLYVEG